MPSKGKPIIILDRYTLIQIARFSSARAAAEELEIPLMTIYSSICNRTAVYDSYFLYDGELELNKWSPAEHAFRRTKGIKVNEKLEELRNRSYVRSM